MSIAAARERHYRVLCPVCGVRREDDGLLLDCTGDHEPALLRTEYAERDFVVSPDSPGLYRYRRWLPTTRVLPEAGRTSVFRSARLGAELGLRELWIAFNGYWPERGAALETGTFKEFEAHAVLGRAAGASSTVVVASAGNTAAAFAVLCSRYALPCVLVVPTTALPRLLVGGPLHPSVRLVAVRGADYAQAIELADTIAARPGFHAEGGTRNIARRDGLGTVLYAAVEAMGRLPTHYFQAIGSGAGAIAVHEAAERIRACSGGQPPRLVLCQNAHFAPVHQAWRAGGRDLVPCPDAEQRRGLALSTAGELTNRRPPYAIHGGVYDVLTASGGDVMVTGNAAAAAAAARFHRLEGADVEPAAGVALSCLEQAAARGELAPDAPVLVNVTGGGRARLIRERRLAPAEPTLLLDADDGDVRALADTVLSQFGGRQQEALR